MLRNLFNALRPRGAAARAAVVPAAAAVDTYLIGHHSSLFALFAPAIVHAPGARVVGVVASGVGPAFGEVEFESRVVPAVSPDQYRHAAAQGGVRLVHFFECLEDFALLEARDGQPALPALDFLALLQLHNLAHTYQPMPVEHDFAMASANIYAALRARLADPLSRRTLDARIQALCSLDRRALLAARLDVEVEYFNRADPVLSLVPGDDEIYVDVGAAHGDTVERFSAVTGGRFREIHAFEPTPGQHRQLAARWAGDPRVRTYQAAVGEAAGTIPFFDNPLAPFGSNALTLEREHAGFEVECVRLDDLIERCTLVKVDVEGFECAVLRGAARLIAQCKPDLAIACYHYPQDLTEIFEQVMALHPYRQVALRHYGPSLFDTVLLFSDRQRFDGGA